MALTPRLDLRQSQTLVMTPQLQQAIKLLQLSNLDLAAYVERELEQNPLLERIEADDSSAAGAEEPRVEDEIESNQDAISRLGDDYENLWGSAGIGETSGGALGGPTRATGGFADVTAMVEQTPSGGIGLRDHLLNQLSLDVLDPVDRVIGVHLIDMLDEAGYLSDDLSPVAQRLGCDAGRVEATLEKLQRFDPPGIFARSLRECLALQLHERGRLDAAMEILLDNLDLLAEQRLDKLQTLCGVGAQDLDRMLAELTSRNPKPGLAFDSEVAQTIVPDVIVRRTPDGGWLVELNTDTLPRVLVNRQYYATVSRQAKSKQDKEYLVDLLSSANWLAKSLDQRAKTILRVATALVRKQDAFFIHGVQHLRPLILRDIAEVIDMHESTVSRVTVNKYMSTPRGTFEMRYFFTTAIPGTGAKETHSSEAVRHRIKALIEDEGPGEVLSDDRLVAILKGEGIDIARRTVAKYRDAMRIASSLQRRRRKKRPR